ncbi:MAG TPA: hypothetical protein VMJ10_01940 [Kofleriaceae bacterium]|nr:hypothetical protein [Kofleriaceae bacterium]
MKPKPGLTLLVVAAVALGAPRLAAAQSAPGAAPAVDAPPAAGPGRQPRDIVVVTEGTRTTQNVVVLGGIALAGLALGGVGLYYNLDARDASNKVTTTMPVGEPWTKALQAEYDQAQSSSTKAEVFYGIGGACVAAAAIAYMLTAPPSETTVIHPRPVATVAPTPGGAVVGGVWRF